MMKKRLHSTFRLLSVGIFSFSGLSTLASVPTDICGTSTDVTLFAGQTINTGTVTIANDEQNLYVSYSTIGTSWYLSETHLHVATSLAEIPQTRSGNPKVGNFDYKRLYDPLVTEDTYVISLADNGWQADGTSSLVIAAHAVVVQFNENGEIIANETGWGNGPDFPGKNWAMYINYTLQACDTGGGGNEEGFLWRTQTQGGWGTHAQGGNPGTFRDANFDGAFPMGLSIGADALDISGNSVFFSSSGAIECFLPQGGTPGTLIQDYVDPNYPCGDEDTDTSAGVLAGQATALTLNVTFDDYCNTTGMCIFEGMDGHGSSLLKDLVVVSDSSTECSGWTVQDILDEVNAVLAGAGQLSPSAINECASSINENFVDGVTDEGYLTTDCTP